MNATPDSAGLGLRLFETPRATVALALLAAVFAATFAASYPAAITVSDEGSYLRQAQLLARGGPTVEIVDPFTGERGEYEPRGQYPLGTALLMVPFVFVGGWRAAYWLPMLCTVGAVFATARWLREAGYSPLWAALLLLYPPAVVMGRVAMSDAPSLLASATGLLLFWRGTRRAGLSFLGAGLVAGYAVAIREGNALVYLPLFVGAVVRRDRRIALLVAGGAVGVGVRLLASWLYFDDPFFVKPPNPFSAENVLENGPLYLAALLVFVPGGLVAGLAYRGPRRIEIVATVALFAGFYCVYGYSAAESGLAKRVVLGPRYFMPLLPILALSSAEVWPRLARRALARAAPDRRRALERVAGTLVLLALGAGAVGIVGVQWVHARWARDQALIRDAIYRETKDGSVVITNWRTTSKYFDILYGDRRVLRRNGLTPAHVTRLSLVNDDVYFVFVDRTDSAFGREDANESARFRHQIANPIRLVYDEQVTPTDRLHIWRIRKPLRTAPPRPAELR